MIEWPHFLWATSAPLLEGHVSLWAYNSMARMSVGSRNTVEWAVKLVQGGYSQGSQNSWRPKMHAKCAYNWAVTMKK